MHIIHKLAFTEAVCRRDETDKYRISFCVMFVVI